MKWLNLGRALVVYQTSLAASTDVLTWIVIHNNYTSSRSGGISKRRVPGLHGMGLIAI